MLHVPLDSIIESVIALVESCFGVFYYQAKLYLTHPLNCSGLNAKKSKLARPISSLIKYQFNKLWFNYKFPNQFFKREEKSNDFFNNLWRKMQARCRATPSYSEIEDTGRKQRKRCLYINWRKQIQLDYINLPAEMQRRKARPE